MPIVSVIKHIVGRKCVDKYNNKLHRYKCFFKQVKEKIYTQSASNFAE